MEYQRERNMIASLAAYDISMMMDSEYVAKVWNRLGTCVISGFCREVDENCGFLCYYTSIIGNSLRKFRDSLSVPSSRVKNSNQELLTLEDWIDRLS